MKCHCTEVEELRVENDLLRERVERMKAEHHSLQKVFLEDQRTIAKVIALVEREEARMAEGPTLFDGSHFPAVVTAGELREVLGV